MTEATEYRSRHEDDWAEEEKGNQWDRGLRAKPEDFSLPRDPVYDNWRNSDWRETIKLGEQFATEWQKVKDQEGWTHVQTEYLKLTWAAEQVAENTVGKVYNNASEQGRERLHQELAERETNLQQWVTSAAKHEAENQLSDYFKREQTQKYGFSIMTRDAIEWIREHLGDAPLIEVGAGTGYLAYEMQSRGIEVNPTEPLPRASGENYWFKGERSDWTDIEICDAQEALVRYPESDLLWSWPHSSAEPHKVLANFGGDRVIHIGDPGATDVETFEKALERDFEITGLYHLPNLPQLHDQITVWERRAEPLDIPTYEGPKPYDWGDWDDPDDPDQESDHET